MIYSDYVENVSTPTDAGASTTSKSKCVSRRRQRGIEGTSLL